MSLLSSLYQFPSIHETIRRQMLLIDLHIKGGELERFAANPTRTPPKH